MEIVDESNLKYDKFIIVMKRGREIGDIEGVLESCSVLIVVRCKF